MSGLRVVPVHIGKTTVIWSRSDHPGLPSTLDLTRSCITVGHKFLRASHIPLPNPGFAKDFYKDLQDQLLALNYIILEPRLSEGESQVMPR